MGGAGASGCTVGGSGVGVGVGGGGSGVEVEIRGAGEREVTEGGWVLGVSGPELLDGDGC